MLNTKIRNPYEKNSPENKHYNKDGAAKNSTILYFRWYGKQINTGAADIVKANILSIMYVPLTRKSKLREKDIGNPGYIQKQMKGFFLLL